MLISTSYFGNFAFWQQIATQEKISIDHAEIYQKQSFRNRTQILSANGVQTLSVPVIKPNGSKTEVGKIQISKAENWQKDHWKAIESAYKHAPYFWYYGEQVKALIFNESNLLCTYNIAILNQVSYWLDLPVIFNANKNFVPYNGKTDLRAILNNNKHKVRHKAYIQVFASKMPFTYNLSILDFLFNIGPISRKLIL